MKTFSGVYRITNKKNGKFYIGCSVCIATRWRSHISALKRGRHSSSIWIYDWRTYGPDTFEVEVLEEIDPNDRQFMLERESFWIQELKPQYNGQSDKMAHGNKAYWEDYQERQRGSVYQFKLFQPRQLGHLTTNLEPKIRVRRKRSIKSSVTWQQGNLFEQVCEYSYE